jgi:uncharacterized protein (DUF433 family)
LKTVEEPWIVMVTTERGFRKWVIRGTGVHPRWPAERIIAAEPIEEVAHDYGISVEAAMAAVEWCKTNSERAKAVWKKRRGNGQRTKNRKNSRRRSKGR